MRRHPPLEPGSGEDIRTDINHQRSPRIPTIHRPLSPPTMEEPKSLKMNRYKSKDPPGTSSYILMNHNSTATYDTDVDIDDDEYGYITSIDVNTESLVEMESPAASTAIHIKRNDPPLVAKRNATNPTVTSSLFLSSYLKTQQQHQRRDVPTEIKSQRQTDVPLPKRFDKDRNLISNAPLNGTTRSPEVTLVANTEVSNAVDFNTASKNDDADENDTYHQSDRLHVCSLEPEASNAVVPSISRGPEEHALSIQKSVQFAVVQVHEHIIFDTPSTSFDSAIGQNIARYEPRQKRQDNYNPPETKNTVVSTVDEYEAQREPQRRRLKEQEKLAGNFNKNVNRTDQLRRILSTGTNSRTMTNSSGDGHSCLSVQNNASEYVSVQELHPKETSSRIGTGSTSQDAESSREPPLSQNANDIFESYQQSFIELEPEEQSFTGTSQQQPPQQQQLLLPQRQRFRSSGATMNARKSRSMVSLQPPRSPVDDTRSQIVHQQPQQGRGLFRRFFSKKDPNLRIEL